MAQSIKDIIEELKKSQGFLLFVSYAVKKDNGEVILEHRYSRQQFVPEDIEKAHAEFKQMVAKDLADSGMNLIKAAQSIADQSETSGEITDAEFKPPSLEI